MSNFDYDAPAEVYLTNSWGAKNNPVTYRRFDRSADAIRFAIEELNDRMQRGIAMEVGDDRFEIAQILELYNSDHYPLIRAPRGGEKSGEFMDQKKAPAKKPYKGVREVKAKR